ncbi:MAG: hypothetical protein IJ849_02305 [Selenomonadaceae bacterium]|nr:hypothetical protein [Selenomonadaceae bacterium]
MEITFDENRHRALLQTLQQLEPQNVYKASSAAAKRAMIAARTAGSRKIRQIYTMKARDINSRVTVKGTNGGAEMKIKGPMEGVKKYRSVMQKQGVFVIIKKGNRTRIPRSFTLNNSFLKREGASRFPIKGIYGPAVPQLFGNPEVVAVMA